MIQLRRPARFTAKISAPAATAQTLYRAVRRRRNYSKRCGVSTQTAALFWKTHGLNELADAQDFVTITRRINGGVIGLAERQRYYETAKRVLGLEGDSDIRHSDS